MSDELRSTPYWDVENDRWSPTSEGGGSNPAVGVLLACAGGGPDDNDISGVGRHCRRGRRLVVGPGIQAGRFEIKAGTVISPNVHTLIAASVSPLQLTATFTQLALIRLA